MRHALPKRESFLAKCKKADISFQPKQHHKFPGDDERWDNLFSLQILQPLVLNTYAIESSRPSLSRGLPLQSQRAGPHLQHGWWSWGRRMNPLTCGAPASCSDDPWVVREPLDWSGSGQMGDHRSPQLQLFLGDFQGSCFFGSFNIQIYSNTTSCADASCLAPITLTPTSVRNIIAMTTSAFRLSRNHPKKIAIFELADKPTIPDWRVRQIVPSLFWR